MRKIVTLLLTILLSSTLQVYAYNLSDFSSDAKIISAMKLLEQSGDTDVFRNLHRYGVRIKFSNLSMVACNPAKCYAVSTYNEYGTRVILINSMYKDAPIEQIACLIAHESCHTANVATLEEETIATQKEAACWTRLKNQSKDYPDTKLTNRLNKISGLYMASSPSNDLVRQKIANSSFYQVQLGLN